jgi:hypothetical protein
VVLAVSILSATEGGSQRELEQLHHQAPAGDTDMVYGNKEVNIRNRTSMSMGEDKMRAWKESMKE